jgi:plastocyanin
VKAVTLVLSGLFLLLAACGSTAAPPSATPGPTPPDGVLTLELVAHNSRFSTDDLRVPAGREFAVHLRNDDRDVHNFELRDAAGNSIFRSELFSGPGERIETLAAVAAGTYQFLCTAHPYMKGTLHAD